jgi:hypothetical protein
MTRRHIHYEAAFEDMLRSTGTPYGTRFFVDIKGRKFPYDTRGGRRYWENWVPREDLDNMSCWDEVFDDDGFVGLLVFAYWLLGPEGRWPIEESEVHPFRGEHYAFLAVTLADYRAHCKLRSTQWDTVSVASATFRKLTVPVNRLLNGS